MTSSAAMSGKNQLFSQNRTFDYSACQQPFQTQRNSRHGSKQLRNIPSLWSSTLIDLSHCTSIFLTQNLASVILKTLEKWQTFQTTSISEDNLASAGPKYFH